MVNLTSLYLCYSAVTDLAPLSAMVNLQNLDLTNTDAIRALSAVVDDLRGLIADAGHSSGPLAEVLAVVQVQAQQIASLVDLVRLLVEASRQNEPASGGVVSASFLNAMHAVGGIGVEPRAGGMLRALFTETSDAVADTVVRWRHALRNRQYWSGPSAAVFDVLSDREEAQHQALWPAFVAAKAAGKRAQFHRARLVVDGERVAAPAC
ncbi:hypothetical protein FOA52_001367 [Chlamydomonas sp. UWO 241]|nr:hypothetical protein FOA52_001367 [Chlamydomonas sp. UWO 241]